MIYTVTFNPSLDYIVTVPDFRLGMTNRTSSEMLLPGGKGINVSIVLSNLGISNTAFYYSAGFVGREITERIEEYGIKAEYIELTDGCSRINLKLKSMDGTEINGMGPEIPTEKTEELLQKLDKLTEGDTLVLAGSIPKSMPDTIYADIMGRLSGKGIRIVVDATKQLLMNVLKYKPFLIKPNNHELGEIFGVELTTRESVVPYAKRLQEMGAVNVLVSMAGEGAVLVSSEGNVFMSEAPEGKLVNGVGAGDSMVAGFLASITKEPEDYEKAFKMGLSAGSASAFSEFLASKEEILSVYNSII
ncbi:MAG: 1-phosphofructokinase [Eubacterium sp.]|nr:1-phosphofructokinase [Eubacterium sp.]